MDINLPIVSGYYSKSQIARVATEEWANRNLYCPACESVSLQKTRANTPAVDFKCPSCQQPFQLKSGSRWNPDRIPDAGYDAMITAIRHDNTPNLFVLQYSDNWEVQNLIVVPHFFFTESTIEKRKPLSPGARRAGWIGCNIILRHVPEDGRIVLIDNFTISEPSLVRKKFAKSLPLSTLDVSLRGWTLDVLTAVRNLGKNDFVLEDIYAVENHLARLHPLNRNIRPKIRQQLQILRDLGMIQFVGQGRYTINGRL